jgi:hypothetical protein
MRRHLWVWALVLAASAAGFAACGGSGGGYGSPPTEVSTTAAAAPSSATSGTTGVPEDVNMTAAMFANIHRLTKVRGFYIGNVLGHLSETLAVANNPKGGVYPVGTIVQLVPQEAMVKRRHGWDASTHDWEMFALDVTAKGTTISTRGAAKTVNRFGMNCASCHSAADPRFDFVCEKDHGCQPLPIGDAVIKSIQDADPRPK